MTFIQELGLDPYDLVGPRRIRTGFQRAVTAEEFLEQARQLPPEDGRRLAATIAQLPANALTAEVLAALGYSGDAAGYDLYGREITLTTEQERIVEMDLQGETLLLRGVAGSGKTSVAVARVVRSAIADDSLEGSYLLVTFGKTLQTVCEELVRTLAGELPNFSAMTFHAWAMSQLERAHYQVHRCYSEKDFDLQRTADITRARVQADDVLFRWLCEREKEWSHYGSSTWFKHLNGAICCPSEDEPERRDMLLRIAGIAVYDIARSGHLPWDWLGFAVLELKAFETKPLREIVVDEVQELAPFEVACFEQLAARTGANLILVGDEAQSIRPQHFSWIDIAQASERECREEALAKNFRSPAELAYQAELVLKAEPEVGQGKVLLRQRDTNTSRFTGSGRYAARPSVSRPSAPRRLVKVCHCLKADTLHALGDYVERLSARVPKASSIACVGNFKKHAYVLTQELRRRGLPVENANDGSRGISLGADSVKVMTARTVTGLEFDHIVAFRLESVCGFPDQDEADGEHYRILHTLITRARKSVVFFANYSWQGNGLTSILRENLDQGLLTECMDKVPADVEV